MGEKKEKSFLLSVRPMGGLASYIKKVVPIPPQILTFITGL